MADRRETLQEELSTLASDLKSLLETLTKDPKEQARRERRWNLLLGITGAVFTLAARRLAAKAWGVLTGEAPPTKGAQAPQPKRPAPEAQPEPSERETEITSV
jgi:hypothetical protein